MLSKEKLDKIIDRVLQENKPAIDELGKNAFGMLMGIIMKEVRGKTNPEVVNKLLKEKLQKQTDYSANIEINRK
jgi:aspartyl-tRNA(Asn)/glutamyl-tRNA(Gln) amidotransferase subunit B